MLSNFGTGGRAGVVPGEEDTSVEVLEKCDGALGERDGSEPEKVVNVLADSGGEPADSGGEPGDPRLRKRCERPDRKLPPGEMGRGVRGMPWFERGRNRRVLLVAVVDAEFGGV